MQYVSGTIEKREDLKPEGIIFDMDDTLVATAELWKEAEAHLLKILGSKWSVELAMQYKGMNTLDVAATIHRLLQPTVSVEYCQQVLREALFCAFEAKPPGPMNGAVECVRRLAGIAPLALASGSPLPLIESVVARLDIRLEFQSLISSESVARGKPFPDVFLASAVALGVKPSGCLVFEDSLVGVRAAKTAGMRCIAIPSSHSDEIAKIANRTYRSLTEVDAQSIEIGFEPNSPKLYPQSSYMNRAAS
ncbi:MAG: HAD family phosphatase [Chthoniobacterales bacterium]